jgi:hypothetical protein
MKTRLLYLTLAFSFIASGIAAQETSNPKIHQVGINFGSLNSFGLHYKTGNEKTMLRLSLLALNMAHVSEWGRKEDSIEYKYQSYGAGFRIGFEKHIPVVARFDFIWGLEAGCNFSFEKNKRNVPYSTNYEQTRWSLSPLVNVILGATYTIADQLVLGAEITPGIIYSYGKSKTETDSGNTEGTTSGIDFGFNTHFASLSVAYRFGK